MKPTLADLELGAKTALKALDPQSSTDALARAELALKVVQDYDTLASELYRARAQHSASHPHRLKIEDAAASLSFELIFRSYRKPKPKAYRMFIQQYRAIWARERYLFVFVLVLFLASALVGFNVALNYPDYAPVLIPQGLMEDILDNRPWFERIKDDPLGAGIGIAINNIKVAVNCFLAGSLLGLGGLLLLGYNGLFFGAIFGFCFANDFHDELGEFVLSHGILEMSIIIAACFSSMLFGRAFFMRPYSQFARRLTEGGRDAAIVALGVTPWLVFAACFEAFVSPYEFLDFETKFLVGLGAAMCFWLWTFWPAEQQQMAAAQDAQPAA